MTSDYRRAVVVAALAALAAALPGGASAQAGGASFTGLSDLGYFRIAGVSADGRLVVGVRYFGDAATYSEWIHWTREGGAAVVGRLPPGAVAYGVSADGSIIVGQDDATGEAYRWTPAGATTLGHFPGYANSWGAAANADGTVVVGASVKFPSGPPPGGAFRWTAAGGMVPLGTPDDGSIATAVSADGNVVVGDVNGDPFRWTAATGMEFLGLPPGQSRYGAWAEDVSSDGRVVVGALIYARHDRDSRHEAFRWTAEAGMVGLGFLRPEGHTRALAANADGSVVVGTAGEEGNDATLWTGQLGTVNLQSYLISQGATGLEGWRLREATDVSADGLTIAGSGTDPAGRQSTWVATVPEPSTALALITSFVWVTAKRRPVRLTK
jgi:uncharacterized membrane protein